MTSPFVFAHFGFSKKCHFADYMTVSRRLYRTSSRNRLEKLSLVYDEHSSFEAVKKCWQNTGCQYALLSTLFRLRFSKFFQSDNHVYCDLNNTTLDFFYLVLSNSF